MLFLDDLGVNSFPIEIAPQNPFFSTNYENLDPNEISMVMIFFPH